MTFLQLHCKCCANKEAEFETITCTHRFQSAASNDRTIWLHSEEIIILNNGRTLFNANEINEQWFSF